MAGSEQHDEVPARSSTSNHVKDPTKKHRHDIGAVDHGPVTTEPTTRAIQGLLGVCIVLSAALAIYALGHVGFGFLAQ